MGRIMSHHALVHLPVLPGGEPSPSAVVLTACTICADEQTDWLIVKNMIAIGNKSLRC